MRGVLVLVLALGLLPAVPAATTGDPVGDQVARFYVAATETPGSVYAQCRDDAADIAGIEVKNEDHVVTARLLVVALGAGPSCPVPLVNVQSDRFYGMHLDRVGGIAAREQKLSLQWLNPGLGQPSGGVMFQDGTLAMCDGGTREAQADALVLSCPDRGTAAGRAYDLRGAQWFTRANTYATHGSQASYVGLLDETETFVAST